MRLSFMYTINPRKTKDTQWIIYQIILAQYHYITYHYHYHLCSYVGVPCKTVSRDVWWRFLMCAGKAIRMRGGSHSCVGCLVRWGKPSNTRIAWLVSIGLLIYVHNPICPPSFLTGGKKLNLKLWWNTRYIRFRQIDWYFHIFSGYLYLSELSYTEFKLINVIIIQNIKYILHLVIEQLNLWLWKYALCGMRKHVFP